MECFNCGKDLRGMDSYARGEAGVVACNECGGIFDALKVGAREPIFVYQRGQECISWGGVVLGKIVHSYTPPKFSRFSPCRFRVQMLDGSMWYGTGPQFNGTYMRLKPMKEAR